MSDAMSDGDTFHPDGSSHSRRRSCAICAEESLEARIRELTYGASDSTRARVRRRLAELERVDRATLLRQAIREIDAEDKAAGEARIAAFQGENI